MVSAISLIVSPNALMRECARQGVEILGAFLEQQTLVGAVPTSLARQRRFGR